MSELIQKNDSRATIRWKLLTSASVLVLTVSLVGTVRAEDADHPLLWIELGGQLEHINGLSRTYAPDFLSAYSTSSILQGKITPAQAQRPPLFSAGEEAKVSFQPEGSDWVMSAAIRYGRSGNKREVDHQTTAIHYGFYHSNHPVFVSQYFSQENFVDSHVYRAESHAIVDFQAGKDIGLGLFGQDISTVLSAGIRFAQFASHSSVDMRARPDLHFKYFHAGSYGVNFVYYHTFHAHETALRKFHGVGPSVSWSGSARLATMHNAGLAFDWGVNAAVLFGRQRARVQHYESGHYQTGLANFQDHPPILTYQKSGGHNSNRSIVVPNLGGFAGLSFRYSDARISLGYRADFFFGAMDTGIDTRKSEDRGFYGPFASLSIGIGD